LDKEKDLQFPQYIASTNISAKSRNLHHPNCLIETPKFSILNGNTASEIGLCGARLIVLKVKSLAILPFASVDEGSLHANFFLHEESIWQSMLDLNW
jgi:hypothetical protein